MDTDEDLTTEAVVPRLVLGWIGDKFWWWCVRPGTVRYRTIGILSDKSDRYTE